LLREKRSQRHIDEKGADHISAPFEISSGGMPSHPTLKLQFFDILFPALFAVPAGQALPEGVVAAAGCGLIYPPFGK
jgi:hypothetical protein